MTDTTTTAGADKIDTSDEMCAVACMLVSNPQGRLRQDGDGWQRRVNDLIRALQDERNVLRAAPLTPPAVLRSAPATSAPAGDAKIIVRNGQWRTKKISCTKLAEWIADQATNDRKGLIQRVAESIQADRIATREAAEARVAELENALRATKQDLLNIRCALLSEKTFAFSKTLVLIEAALSKSSEDTEP